MEKKDCLLVMAATGDYIFSIGNVLIGLKKYSPNMFDDIIIYTDKTITEQNRNAILKIFPVQFKYYEYQIKNVDDRERLKYYSNMPYARFEMLTYLNKYKKVFWFDSDFLIVDDISDLKRYGNTGISMSIDLDPYPQKHGVHMFFIKNIPGYNMNAEAYASGLLIFSDKLSNPLQLRKYLYEKLEQYSGYIRFAEQGILQLMIEDFKLNVEKFPKLIYHTYPFEDKTKSKIIHLLDYTKPWIHYSGSAYDEWYENHKYWISINGEEAYSFKNLLQQSTLRKFFYGNNRYQNLLLNNELHKINDKINNNMKISSIIKFNFPKLFSFIKNFLKYIKKCKNYFFWQIVKPG